MDVLSMDAAPDLHPVDIRREGPSAIAIDWSDGHHGLYSFRGLRDSCPCATCKDHREKAAADKKAGRIALTMAAAGPAEPLAPKQVAPVGRYAYNIVWSDGHATGIYRFDLLRALCECRTCRPGHH